MQTYLRGRVRVVVGDITTVDVTPYKTPPIHRCSVAVVSTERYIGQVVQRFSNSVARSDAHFFLTALPTGEAVITTAGELPAQYVIHTVGPIYGTHRGREPELLADCLPKLFAARCEIFVKLASFSGHLDRCLWLFRETKRLPWPHKPIQEFLAGDDLLKEIQMVFFQPVDAEVFIQNQKFR